jgi:NTE family protein
VLSPVTLNNYGGNCGYQYPAWVQDIANPAHRVRPAGRAYQRYKEMQDFQNSEDRPYIHLVDGGVSDNIGVRGVLEALEELAASSAFRGEVGFGAYNKVVLMVVNAHSAPSIDWDRKENPPGFAVQLLQSSGVPIDRYSFETIETMKDMAEIWKWRRDLKVAQARLAGVPEAEAEASVPEINLEVVDISFDAIPDPEERTDFMNLPTSFTLPAEDIDRLREVAGELMRQSVDYASIVHSFGGGPVQ